MALQTNKDVREKKKKYAFIPHNKMETISIFRKIISLWFYLLHLDMSNKCNM